MTTIVLYSPYWRNMGGGERYLLQLASSLSKMPGAEVTALSEFPEITKDRLELFFMLDLSNIDYRIFRDGTRTLRESIRGADIFIPLSNYRYVRAAPKNYIQALQVPYASINLLTVSKKIIRWNLSEGVKDLSRLQLLYRTRKNSTLTLTNSGFVHDSLLQGFGVKSSVLYPPIEDFLAEGLPKRRTILSVGRIFRGLYNDKRYDVLTKAFQKLSNHVQDWEYHIVGSVSSDKKSQAYLEELKKANKDFPVFFHANASHESLKTLYNEATIYWHAAGYGVDEDREPERTEHFGMSVVEGLSAKCIPIIVNKGGLKEIISPGKNGFLWETVDELVQRTLQVANMKEDSLMEIRKNARQRYSDFSLNRFEERVSEIFLPFLG